MIDKGLGIRTERHLLKTITRINYPEEKPLSLFLWTCGEENIFLTYVVYLLNYVRSSYAAHICVYWLGNNVLLHLHSHIFEAEMHYSKQVGVETENNI